MHTATAKEVRGEEMNDFDAKARAWDQDPIRIERTRAVADTIARLIPLDKTMHCLEYGAGTGLLGFALQPQVGSVVLADSSAGMLAVAGEKIAAAGLSDRMRTARIDLLQDPLPGERFDLLCTLLTLHHIPDIPAILAKFNAVLTHGGRLCISDIDSEDGSFHQGPFEGHHGFDRPELSRLVEEAGFVKVRIETAYVIPRMVNGVMRQFPLFLLTAEKIKA
jgi:ubiquinone/menaquinone biosynthesis C-methylase UbiE